MNQQKQLLCTFSKSLVYNNDINDIKNRYELIDRKIFVFANLQNLSDLYLTFNIPKSNNMIKHRGTISIHRKKQTNTLYTLNAMNRLIADENNGVYDRNYQLNWNLYKDCIILTNEIGTKIINLKLFSIVPA